MALASNSENNLRLCRLHLWPNYQGLGFDLRCLPPPPHLVGLVRSNSPAAAGGLKIRDVLLAVNQQDVSNVDYQQVIRLLRTIRDSNHPVELLVVEQRFYETLKKKNISIHSMSATIINAPARMPDDYLNFPKNQPRTCHIHLDKSDSSFGFEVVQGEDDVGAYIQEVFPNTSASKTSLRKSDHIIKINGKFVDRDKSKSILKQLNKAEAKGAVKLYVMDTETYEYYQLNEIPLASKDQRKNKLGNWLSRNRNGRQSPAIDNGRQLAPSNTSTVLALPKARTTSLSDLSLSSGVAGSSVTLPLTIPPLVNEDIRLCTINRADALDTFGLELVWHCRKQFYSLSIMPGRDNGPSNAELAGIKTDDRLIEINGQNIDTFNHNQVIQCLRTTEYPRPLQMLVADVRTYEYYKQQKKLIHHRLPNVKIMPSNISTKPSSYLHEVQIYKPPPTWEKSKTHQIRFALSKTNDEYQLSAFKFDQAMKGKYTQIIRIERIQNERCYMQYLVHHTDFKRRLNIDTERCLYHGCPERAANSIIEDGFNRSFAGVHGNLYGFGVYFSTNAVYSHGYATPNANGIRCMFVARVLIGKTTRGDSLMKTRPLGFDSTTDNDHIFVIYHDAQAFAEYLITYR